MTCIVGFADRSGNVWLGGDRAGSNSETIEIRSRPKVFRPRAANDDLLIGFSGSFRMGQLLEYHLQPPETQERDALAYLVRELVPAVRACLKEGGYARKDAEVEQGGFFLVAYRGQLFRVESDYQVGEVACGYDAIGSGRPHALGALAVLSAQRGTKPEAFPPESILRMALSAAVTHNPYVRGPFDILHHRYPAIERANWEVVA